MSTPWEPVGDCQIQIESQLSALSHLCAPALEMLVLDFTPNEQEIELFTGGAPRGEKLSCTYLCGSLIFKHLLACPHNFMQVKDVASGLKYLHSHDAIPICSSRLSVYLDY
ncbi:hypothetical protein PILCRDRAFT_14931 [Piloderma croceum F 1598]|uniref:Uncharacterized protein n=1 Tax=Piloderma croceum (strain F 1598) TaxID=765440 RepID=A0A0C3F1G5_PILCF|nr:hypothetical protein PILCRDRAFT_14931 [Piloderma croceum F 1598]